MKVAYSEAKEIDQIMFHAHVYKIKEQLIII